LKTGCCALHHSGAWRLTRLSRYAIFHPLAYLVKLNIEMSMAHLIKKIATDRSRQSDLCIIPNSHNSAFKNCCTQDSDSLPPSRQTISVLKSVFVRDQPSLPATKNEIIKTEEFRVQSGQITDLEMQQSNQKIDPEIYDGSSFVSNNESVAWADVERQPSDDENRDSSSLQNHRTSSSANDEALLIRPAPAVLRPA
jgi:hypothetical protein